MHDVLLALAAGIGPLIGLAVGYVAGRRRGPQPVQALCGCKHSLAMHDPQNGTCSATVGDWHWEEVWDPAAEELVNRRVWKTCPCRQYVGPRPIDSVFAPPLLPPGDLS
jgi:hypothetical protein